MIVFDIDGTLSIVGDRLKYLEQEPKDWDSFYEACDKDEVNFFVAFLCRQIMIPKRYKIAFVTGRPERVRKKTINWLSRYNLWEDNTRRCRLLMRPDEDHRHDTIVKPELIKDISHEVNMIFEDRNSMVKKWRELGYTCLQVAEGDF